MSTKPIALLAAVLTTATLASPPVLAAKAMLTDEAIAEISGAANNITFNGNFDSSASLTGGANGNIQISGYQWADEHTNDQSQYKGSNNQSGAYSQVQQNINGEANALFVGAVSQNVLISSGETIGGSQNVTGYAVVARGGF